MPHQHTNITLGTAGHIDHGKTALIKCLTGCDTDRLKAEKERGMSIDLGFAPCHVAGLDVGIVDVPGHENFIKTMVAGAAGMDGVIFVVAADDGIMPQTREHLDILTLLGLQHGVVALTKIDRVTPDQQQAVTDSLKNYLRTTFLHNAPICPLSNTTGQGFDTFLQALQSLVAAITPKSIEGVFRMPVERTFSVKGHGTVLAGIPICGSAKIQTDVILLPQNQKGRIKAIQVYKSSSDTVMAGQCAALNIPQLDHHTITRGNVLTVGNYFSPQMWFLCNLRLLETAPRPLTNGQRIKFHTGTSEVQAAAYLINGDRLAPSQSAIVQLRTNEPIIAGPNDRFVIRHLSPEHTIGGGIIIEPLPKRLKRTHPNVQQDVIDRANAVPHLPSFIEYCVKHPHTTRTDPDTTPTDLDTLSYRTKTPQAQTNTILNQLIDQNKILPLPHQNYLHIDSAQQAEQQILEIIRQFHLQSPESPGITPEDLLQASALPKPVLEHLLDRLQQAGHLTQRRQRYALTQHQETFRDGETELINAVEALFRNQPFNPPTPTEIPALLVQTHAGTPTERTLTPEKSQRIVRILLEHKRLILITPTLLFHASAVDQARTKLTDHLRTQGSLQSVDFKYLLDTTRKFAIPLLDYFDQIGLTRRTGYTRYLKNPDAQ